MLHLKNQPHVGRRCQCQCIQTRRAAACAARALAALAALLAVQRVEAELTPTIVTSRSQLDIALAGKSRHILIKSHLDLSDSKLADKDDFGRVYDTTKTIRVRALLPLIEKRLAAVWCRTVLAIAIRTLASSELHTCPSAVLHSTVHVVVHTRHISATSLQV